MLMYMRKIMFMVFVQTSSRLMLMKSFSDMRNVLRDVCREMFSLCIKRAQIKHLC